MQIRLAVAVRFGNVPGVKRIWSWLAVGWLGLGVPAALGAAPVNLVVVVADDLGWTDTGFAGSRFYETPQLDALAAQGLRFTSYYASPVGAPTMASILTGLGSPGTGVHQGERIGGEEGTRERWEGTNLASVLRGAGYRSGFVGVWRLGMAADCAPTGRGFDESWVATPKHLGFEVHPQADVPAGTHLTDFLSDRSLDFLERHREGPFFLLVSHFSVHAPPEPKAEWVRRFEKKPPAGGHRDVAYAAMISGLDESVGKIVARLESLHLTDRTVVVFLSDNGGVGGYLDGENSGRRTGVTDNSPLRGGKGMVYEGGMRVPFLVRWPGVIPGGTRTTAPASVVDLFPTFCEIAGIRPEASYPLEGMSLLPLWKNPAGHLGRDALYWHFPDGVTVAGGVSVRTAPVSLVRAGNFKLLEWLEEGRTELYNVVEDLGEKNNLVRSLPEKASELRAKLGTWKKGFGIQVSSR